MIYSLCYYISSDNTKNHVVSQVYNIITISLTYMYVIEACYEDVTLRTLCYI